MKQKEELQLQDINKAINILKAGGVVIFPTDTVYGIGCSYDDQRAQDRIYKVKGTKKTQAFPILITSTDQLDDLVDKNPQSQELMQKYWPGGLTIIMNSKSTGAKVGLRMPDSDIVISLIKGLGRPIIGTSANFHGQKPPTNFEELNPEFTRLADYVLKGECKTGIESTVVDATVLPVKVLRQGVVKLANKL
jgi:L-threonylcarbamoyladenylate synthase